MSPETIRGNRGPVAGSIDTLVRTLRWARLQVILRAEEALHLPPYAGSTFRGAFGQAFKRVACPLRGSCETCTHQAVCVYINVFETPGSADGSSLARAARAAHPFVLEPSDESAMEVPPGDRVTLGLTLIGRAIGLAPYFVAACRELGRQGVGRGRGRCTVERVVAEDPENVEGRTVYDGTADLLAPAVPVWSGDTLVASFDKLRARGGAEGQGSRGVDAGPRTMDDGPWTAVGMGDDGTRGDEQRVTLEFLTPARLRQDADLVVQLNFTTLATALLRRVSVLAEVHCGHRTTIDAKAILATAADVKVEKSDLRWHDWERYSTRQGTRMKLGGFVGRVTFAGPLGPWWPLLRLGEVLHVGKGTAFGLGKYRVAEEP